MVGQHERVKLTHYSKDVAKANPLSDVYIHHMKGVVSGGLSNGLDRQTN